MCHTHTERDFASFADGFYGIGLKVILHIECSKGTYIRSIAHELGLQIKSGAHLSDLIRTRCGPYRLEDCQHIIDVEKEVSII